MPKTIEQVIGNVFDAAHYQGLNIQEINQENIQEKNGYQACTYKIVLAAPFEQMNSFLSKLAQDITWVKIEQYSLEPKLAQVCCTLFLKMYKR